jgi:hypothetical protein
MTDRGPLYPYCAEDLQAALYAPPTDPGKITRFDWFLLVGGMLIGAALMLSVIAYWEAGQCPFASGIIDRSRSEAA